MSILSIVWIIVGVCILAGTSFYHGYTDATEYDISENIPIAVCVAVFWPIILMLIVAAIVIIAPIYGLIRLGKFASSRTR